MGTDANPNGPDHVYMTLKGRGKVDVGETLREIEPGTLVYFPSGVPHRLNAHGGPLDYFEIAARAGVVRMVEAQLPNRSR